MRVLRVSSVAGVFVRPRFDPSGIRDFVGSFDFAGGELSAAGGEFAVCSGGCRDNAVNLPSAVFVRVFL